MRTFLAQGEPIALRRKIRCIPAVLAAGLTLSAGVAVAADPEATRAGADAPATPLRADASADLVRADVSQAGRKLILSVRTAAPVPLASLNRFPRRRSAEARYLCFGFRRPPQRGERELCLGPPKAHAKVGLSVLSAAGTVKAKHVVPVRVIRPSRLKLVVALVPGAAGLAPHRYRWRVLESPDRCRPRRSPVRRRPAGGSAAGAATICRETLPARGSRLFRLRPVRPVGCTGGTAGLDSHGPRGRKAVALTFDDGPSDYTPAFLDVLRRNHVHSTFFEIGQEMGGRESTMRRLLREGNEIGTHTLHHTFYPSYATLAASSAQIESITHFRPCLFRPPGGAFNSSVIAAAGEAGLRTILWDVDPTDWSNPGSGAVYSRVVDAVRPGSIVVMHDGGGDRSGTLAALPAILHTLHARGYRLVTVTRLLGYRTIYRPYG